MLGLEDAPPAPHGFYVVHWVTAPSIEQARDEALELVRSSPKVAGQDRLHLELDEIEEASPADRDRPPTGFAFYPDEAPSN